MFFVLNLKKIRLWLLTALLFCALTAIIIARCQLSVRAEDVPGSAAEHVMIIDAGHGGLDGGASSADGTLESAVNLAIAQKLEFLADFLGVETVMTRTSEQLDYPDDARTVHEKKVWDQKSRIELINSTENAVLISIHQNKYPDPRPRGSQVLYAATEGSQEFGELTHNALISTLNPENRRVTAPISDSIYLMKNIRCPAILVECGFLSNREEAALLADGSYQTKLSMVLLSSYLHFVQSDNI
jgi:N-acetylmuramoyl-L-alanine amidase